MTERDRSLFYPYDSQMREGGMRGFLMRLLHIRLGVTAFFLAVMLFPGAASAQEKAGEASGTAAPATAPDVAAQTKSDREKASGTAANPLHSQLTKPEDIPQVDRSKFDAVIDEWRKVTAEYVREVQQWHLREPSAKDAETRRKWGELQGKSRAAFDRAMVEATEIARVHLRAHPDVTLFLLQSVVHRAERNWYELTGPAADILLSAGPETLVLMQEADVNPADLWRAAGNSYFMTHEYDKADHFLKLAEQGGFIDEKEANLRPALEAIRRIYEVEAQSRKEDAEKNDLPRVEFVTSRGSFVLELYEDQAPNTVANFISLVEKGFYNDNAFYQVIKGLMALTGDPNGDGNGNSGYQIADEHQLPGARKLLRGSVMMAKLPDGSGEPGASVPNSASSQFFIAMRPIAGYPETHTVFGRVIEGMDTVVSLTIVDPKATDKTKRQATPDVIFEARVIRKRDHPYVPVKFDELHR